MGMSEGLVVLCDDPWWDAGMREGLRRDGYERSG